MSLKQSNLIGNAVKFTKEGNIDITMKILQDDNTVVFSVKHPALE